MLIRPLQSRCVGRLTLFSPPNATIDIDGRTTIVRAMYLDRIPHLVDVLNECTSIRINVEMRDDQIVRVIFLVDDTLFLQQVQHKLAGEVHLVSMLSGLKREHATHIFHPHEAIQLMRSPADEVDEYSLMPSTWSAQYPLHERQLKSIAWMRRRETERSAVIQPRIQIVEGWVVDVELDELTREVVSETIDTHGGILCDGAGTGKTAVALALTLSSPPRRPPGASALGRARGSLIIVPLNLTAQWLAEIEKFWTNTDRVVRLFQAKDLKAQTLHSLSEARLVITTISFLRNNRTYTDMVEQALQSFGGRKRAAFTAWLRSDDAKDDPIVEALHWPRVVVDELHELVDNSRDLRLLRMLRRDWMWGLTATPDLRECSFDNIHSLFCSTDGAAAQHAVISTNIRGAPSALVSPKNSLMLINATADERRLIQAHNHLDVEDVVKLCSFMSIEDDDMMYMGDTAAIKDRILRDHALRIDTLNAQLAEQDRCINITEAATNAGMDVVSSLEDELRVASNRYKRHVLEAQLATARNGRDSQVSQLNDLRATRRDLAQEIDTLERSMRFVEQRIEALGCAGDDAKCVICMNKRNDCITPCGHTFCRSCIVRSLHTNHSCPTCRTPILPSDLQNVGVGSVGSKLAAIARLAHGLDAPILIFAQWKGMLRELGALLDQMDARTYFLEGNMSRRVASLQDFSRTGGVLLLCLDDSFAGLHLPCAQHIIFAHALLGTADEVRNCETQAIARALRPGQANRVHVYSFVVADCAEERQWRTTHIS